MHRTMRRTWASAPGTVPAVAPVVAKVGTAHVDPFMSLGMTQLAERAAQGPPHLLPAQVRRSTPSVNAERLGRPPGDRMRRLSAEDLATITTDPTTGLVDLPRPSVSERRGPEFCALASFQADPARPERRNACGRLGVLAQLAVLLREVGQL